GGRATAARLSRAHSAPPLRRAVLRGDRFDEEASPRHRQEQALSCAKLAQGRARALRGTPMKTDACERYLADPEANESHLAECEECAALFGASDIEFERIDTTALPLAPWEGAAHKSWPLVIGGALTVLCVAAAMFTVAGVA